VLEGSFWRSNLPHCLSCILKWSQNTIKVSQQSKVFQLLKSSLKNHPIPPPQIHLWPHSSISIQEKFPFPFFQKRKPSVRILFSSSSFGVDYKWRPLKSGIFSPPTLLETKFSYKNDSTPYKFLNVGHHMRMPPIHMKEINAKIVLLNFLSCNTTQHLIFQLRFRTYVCLCIMSLLFLSHQEMLRNFSFSQNKIQHRKKSFSFCLMSVSFSCVIDNQIY